MILLFSVLVSTDRFQIVVDNGVALMKDSQLQLHVKAYILWLRHICCCQNCLNKKRSISFINFFELYNNLQPVMATVEEETRRLDIICKYIHILMLFSILLWILSG